MSGQMPGPGWGAIPMVPKPGVIPLQPLGVGEIIGGVFATLRRYGKQIYLPVLAATLGVVLALSLCAVVATLSLGRVFDAVRDSADYEPTGGEVFGLVLAFTVGALILLVGLFAVSVVASTVSTVAVRHAVLGRQLTTRQIWAESRTFLWRVLWVQVLAGLAGAGIMVAAALVTALMGALGGSGFGVAGVLILVIPGWVATIYVEVRLVLAVPALVLENLAPRAALRRAWKLNEGAWWRSLGIPYLISLIGSFATQFLMMPFGVIGAVFLVASSDNNPDAYGVTGPSTSGIVGFVILMVIGGVVATAAGLPLNPLTHALLYADRRIRNENLAAVLAAEVGLPPQDAPGAAPGAPGPYPV